MTVLQLGIGRYAEARVVTLLLLTNAALGFVQEGRAQATLDALKSRLALLAAVRRDDVWATVPAATLVPGDLVKLSLGSVVPADVRLDGGSVLVGQSILTGGVGRGGRRPRRASSSSASMRWRCKR